MAAASSATSSSAPGTPIHISGDRVECVLHARHELGEGAIWNWRRGCYMHVDILGKAVYTHDPYTPHEHSHSPTRPCSCVRKYDMPSYVGTCVPRATGGAVVALETAVGFLDLDTGEVQVAHDMSAHADARVDSSTHPSMRFNDGKAAPDGRFWAGTMQIDEPRTPCAALYCMHTDGRVVRALDGITISNGLCWDTNPRRWQDGGGASDPKRRAAVMYYVDTPLHRVDAFDYNASTGEISNRRVAFTIDRDGHPDGCTLDADGNLWVALWGAGQVVCYDPCTGTPHVVIHVPTPRVSSVAFGGPELQDLYITTAQEGMTVEERASDPHAGCIFMVRAVGPRGVPTSEFG